MSEKEKSKTKKSVNADWFVQGILSKIGDIFDRMTGRGAGTASSLSTSELNERLKKLLDSEVKDLGDKGKFVPHNIKLNMQWNKFSTDSEEGLKKLEYELLASAIDHINDNLYHTYKPLKIEVKPDYFTEGVKFLSSFGEFGDEESEAEFNITVPQMKAKDLIPEVSEPEPDNETYVVEFSAGGKSKTIELKFNESKKRMSVGRTKENDLMIDDISISKVHAALVMNPQKMLLVADTGSTNGTFINGERIAYGRSFPIGENDKVKFGNVEVFLRRVPKPTDFATQESYAIEQPATAAYQLEPASTEAFLPPLTAVSTPPIDTVKAAPIKNNEVVPPPTEAFQMQEQKAEDLTKNDIPVSVPKNPPYDFGEEKAGNPAAKTNQSETSAEQNEVSPSVPQNISETESKKDEQVNPTEPRIKYNFDE